MNSKQQKLCIQILFDSFLKKSNILPQNFFFKRSLCFSRLFVHKGSPCSAQALTRGCKLNHLKKDVRKLFCLGFIWMSRKMRKYPVFYRGLFLKDDSVTVAWLEMVFMSKVVQHRFLLQYLEAFRWYYKEFGLNPHYLDCQK